MCPCFSHHVVRTFPHTSTYGHASYISLTPLMTQNSEERSEKQARREKLKAHPFHSPVSSSSPHLTNESHLRCLEGWSPSMFFRRFDQPRILCRLCSPRQHRMQNNFGKQPWTCVGRREKFNCNNGCSDIFFDLGRFGYSGRIVAGADIGRTSSCTRIRLHRLRRARRRRILVVI